MFRNTKYFDFIVPILLLLFATILFRIINLDMMIQRTFHFQDSGWFLAKVQPWNFLYHFGNIPALILSISALVMLIIGLNKVEFFHYTKISLFLILVMAIGPGLIVNSILKDNWGRPRPRNVQEFGGKYNYEEILTIDPESKGKSFPCGHASMGFYFFVLYFVFRKKRKTLALCSFIFALVYGALIGSARIVQGGHFASDVIWVAGLIYLVSASLFYLMGLNRKTQFQDKYFITDSKKRIFISFIIGLLILIGILLVSLATPYSKSKTYSAPPDQFLDESTVEAEIQLLDSEILIQTGEEFSITNEVEGFGFPKSKIRNKFDVTSISGTSFISYSQRLKGFFTELDQINRISIPSSWKGKIILSSQSGNLTIMIPENNNWLIISENIESIIDKTDYLSATGSSINNEQTLQLKIDIPLGKLEIIR